MELNRPSDRIASAEPGKDGLASEAARNRSEALDRNGLLCALIFAVCVLLTYPLANMPYMDDFSYAKTALEFARTGKFVYNGWATAMLGWQVPWGALFIKFFGFSFNVLRLSMLPIAMGTVYLFHQILRRFGINPQNAIVGTLAMSLSPLFLPLATSFMTDIPGLLVILICIYMCQRAVSARTDRSALIWLYSAMLVNVAEGTVRQIAWLGALIMVPSTAWLLRRRHGMKIAGPVTFLLSLLGVLACLHWFKSQPYSLPEYVSLRHIHARMLVHLSAQYIKTFLCLLLLIFPVSAAWLAAAPRLTGKARLRFAGAMVVLVSLAIVFYRDGAIGGWVMPWLIYTMATEWNLLPTGMFLVTSLTADLWIRGAISLLVIAPAFILLEQMSNPKLKKLDSVSKLRCPWKELAWILGPFSFSYILLLTPSGIFSQIQDRYVLGLVPVAIIVLLLLYQERFPKKLSTFSIVALILFAVCSIASTHDIFAKSRAVASTIQMVQSTGVSRMSIHSGLSDDGWVQIKDGGHINDQRIKIPAGAYSPKTSNLKIPDGCVDPFAPYLPAIIPKYFIVSDPHPCFADTNYPPIRYRIWLPPFHQAIYVQKLKDQSR